MSSDSSEKCTAAAKAYFHGAAKPPEQDQLPCPRCQSSNIKFCYYNNYNLSQPRYFCKSCRRYWTRGGTLRNVPVGGGTRKSSSLKRSRAAAASSPTTTTGATSPASCKLTHIALQPDPDDQPARTKSDGNMNQAIPVSGGFGSLLGGLPQVGLFGSFGIGSSLKGMGFGWDWPAVEGGGASGVVGPECNTWQVVEGECFGWPDLTISNRENGV